MWTVLCRRLWPTPAVSKVRGALRVLIPNNYAGLQFGLLPIPYDSIAVGEDEDVEVEVVQGVAHATSAFCSS